LAPGCVPEPEPPAALPLALEESAPVAPVELELEEPAPVAPVAPELEESAPVAPVDASVLIAVPDAVGAEELAPAPVAPLAAQDGVMLCMIPSRGCVDCVGAQDPALREAPAPV